MGLRECDWEDLQRAIAENKPHVDRLLLQSKSAIRPIRTRPRDPDEIKVLDRLCVLKWEAAEKSGKVKYLSKNEWYYEP
jgi:hypothetical protein